jgi:hypothetical protein
MSDFYDPQQSQDPQTRMIGAPQPNIEPAPAYPSGSSPSTNIGGSSPDLGPQPPAYSNQQGGSPLKNVLGRFFYGAGQSMLKSAGLPTDYDIQNQQIINQARQQQTAMEAQQTQGQALQNQMVQRRISAMQDMSQHGFNDPFQTLGTLNAEEEAQRQAGTNQAVMTGDLGHVFQAVHNIASTRAIWGRGAAQGNYDQIQVTPQMVQAGAPKEWEGQTKAVKELQPFLSRAVFGTILGQGAQGAFSYNRNPMSPNAGAVTPLGQGNPSLATANATKLYPIARGNQIVYATPQEARGQMPANLPTTSALDDDPNSPTFGQTVLMTKNAAVGKVQLSGQERSRGGAARSAIDIIPKITAEIDKPEVRAALGPIQGRITMAEIMAGNVDPALAPLSALIKQEYALQTTAHGWRAFEAPVAFEQAIGGLRTNPDALRAGMIASGNAMTAIANPAASRNAIPQAVRDRMPKQFSAPPQGAHPLDQFWRQ